MANHFEQRPAHTFVQYVLQPHTIKTALGGRRGRSDCPLSQMGKLRVWLPSPLFFLLPDTAPHPTLQVTPGPGPVLWRRVWPAGHLGTPVSTAESAQRRGEGHPRAARGEGAAAGVHPD